MGSERLVARCLVTASVWDEGLVKGIENRIHTPGSVGKSTHCPSPPLTVSSARGAWGRLETSRWPAVLISGPLSNMTCGVPALCPSDPRSPASSALASRGLYLCKCMLTPVQRGFFRSLFLLASQAFGYRLVPFGLGVVWVFLRQPKCALPGPAKHWSFFIPSQNDVE